MQAYFTDSGYAHDSDRAACRASIRAGSKSFFAASLLLPAGVREPAHGIYAFCRLADDAVDDGGGRIALEHLRNRLELAYAARPFSAPEDRAFAEVVARYSIPRVVPEALLEGFQWDTENRRYEDIHALNEYAARVAGSVGAMMACLMNARAPHIVARACDLGVAMQLTNIARDVGEDARAGRLYLPLSWMREAGMDPAVWLQNPEFSPAIAEVTSRLLDAADVAYARADSGIAQLPGACQPAIRAARTLYAEIGHELRRNGLDSVSRRTVLHGRRKLALLARAMIGARAIGGSAVSSTAEWAPALEETQFLVDAAAATATVSPTALPRSSRPRQPDFQARMAWLADLFERLEHRDRQQQERVG